MATAAFGTRLQELLIETPRGTGSDSTNIRVIGFDGRLSCQPYSVSRTTISTQKRLDLLFFSGGMPCLSFPAAHNPRWPIWQNLRVSNHVCPHGNHARLKEPLHADQTLLLGTRSRYAPQSDRPVAALDLSPRRWNGEWLARGRAPQLAGVSLTAIEDIEAFDRSLHSLTEGR